jgi:hypothetical protein
MSRLAGDAMRDGCTAAMALLVLSSAPSTLDDAPARILPVGVIGPSRIRFCAFLALIQMAIGHARVFIKL